MEATDRQMFIDELKKEWRVLWRDRVDDRVRAEGIASQDYPRLCVERGLVIVATRDYEPPDFLEILRRHNLVPPGSPVGGWGRFIRDFVSKQRRFTRREPVSSKPERREKQQRKKSGRGWLHL